jgi:DNA-binding NtrC family response regulator
MVKILIVDDDEDWRKMFSRIMKDRGYMTDEASSGVEAIEKVSSEHFDIVLLDLIMPKISGMDALAEIRKINTRTKVIIVTGFATIGSAVEAMKRGASDYISKPFNAGTLDLAIRRAIEMENFDLSSDMPGLDQALKFLSNSLRREIIKLIEKNKGIRLMELAKTLCIEDHTKVSFHLKMLKDSGIITQKKKAYVLTKNGHETLYYLKILESHL